MEIAEKLARNRYRISPDTLYPTLHRLEKGSYLKSVFKIIEDRVRIYYQAADEGKRVIEQARAKTRELVAEVIEER